MKIKEEYLANAEKYSEGCRRIFEDHVKGKEYKSAKRLENQGSERCQEIFLQLRTSGDLKQIEEFMDHVSPYVRYITSAHCLYSNPEVAEKTLEELIESSSPIRMNALATLKAWRNISWTEDRYK